MAITIDTDECEASGACAMVCPEDVIDLHDGRPVIVNSLACTSCWKCVESCISGAIDID